jgi:hypothetical protein
MGGAVTESPRVEGCREAVPGVCMASDAHYTRPNWERLPALQRLTDKRIAFYQQRGRYHREARLRMVRGNRLVYTC